MAQLPDNIARAISQGIYEGLQMCGISLRAGEEEEEESGRGWDLVNVHSRRTQGAGISKCPQSKNARGWDLVNVHSRRTQGAGI